MLTLILSVVLLGIILFTITYFKRKNSPEDNETYTEVSDGCCGAHVVCEMDSLLNNDNKIIYYDDEELDVLADIPASEFNTEQIKLLSDIFFSLKEPDVAGWLRSLQLRNIQLPLDLREEVLLVVGERRMAI